MGSQSQPREDDTDHVRNLQLARHVRRHPSCPLPVRFWSYHRYRPRLRRWCLPHRPNLRRYDHVPRYRRPYAEGDLRPRPTHHEDQDRRPTREEILRLDWRIHLGFPVHLPTDVDQQTRIRRIWPIHCSPKMLLDRYTDILLICCTYFATITTGKATLN